MAEVSVINVTSLTPIVAAAIVSGQQVTIYDQGGIAYRAPIEDVMSAAQRINECHCVMHKKITIETADVLQLFTTPVAFGITVPSGYYIKVLGADARLRFNTTAYDTNTDLYLGYSGGGGSYFFRTVESLLSVSTNLQSMEFQGFPSVSNSGGDIIAFVMAGNPLNGDSPIDIYINYVFVEL